MQMQNDFKPFARACVCVKWRYNNVVRTEQESKGENTVYEREENNEKEIISEKKQDVGMVHIQ